MNKAIAVQYAFKKDGRGERHGTSAERLLAAQARKNNAPPVSCPAIPRADDIWCATARAWVSRTVPGSIHGRVGAAASAAWVYTSANGDPSDDGCAGCDANGDGSAAAAREYVHLPAWLVRPTATT